MALSTRLVLKQGQSLVMTPQLLQAIKLLQLSNVELAAYVEQELERNPLLERDDSGPDGPAPDEVSPSEGGDDFQADDFQAGEYEAGEFEAGDFRTADGLSGDDGFAAGGLSGGASERDIEAAEGDWARETMEVDQAAMAEHMGTELDNAFDADAAPTASERSAADADDGLSATSWTGAPGSGPGGAGGEEAPNLEAYVAAATTLADHLNAQLAMALTNAVDMAIGHALIDAIDDSGYMREDLAELAARLGAPLKRAQRILSVIQTFDPTGVGARDLAECLAIQLRERDRYDPAMQALVENLPLLARRDFAQLRKLCGVDQDDMADMVAELRRLDPKPGRSFGAEPIQPVAPDVTVRAAADGSWRVEINPEGLPRVLVNQTYAARVQRGATNAADKTYVAECLQNANWLTRSLEQRARTILKVATEIVRQQDSFFAYGVEHLRPLNLKTVADAIGMHESTVSRVTSNKFLSCARGLFEFKYFFTAAIQSHAGGAAHSAESVRFRIKQLIDHESPTDVLSDDAIVERLKQANIDIARRTVAKYRESLRIPSSVERRREKMALRETPAAAAAAVTVPA